MSTLAAPTLNTGFMAVPTPSLTVISAVTTLYLYGFFFANTTSDPISVTVTDTAGLEILPARVVPPNDFISEGWALKPSIGLKWSATASGINGHIWGYTSWPL